MKDLIIRVDANTQIGTGHLMRCFALGQTWQSRGGEVTFVTASHDNVLLSMLQREGFSIYSLPEAHPDTRDWQMTSAHLSTFKKSCIILDGYHFTPDYQKNIYDIDHLMLLIDDIAHLDYYHTDILLNQNSGAQILDYQTDSATRFLLGTDYALLRKEFWPWQNFQRVVPNIAKNVLVTLGGSDPNNLTLKVIQALEQIEHLKLDVAVIVGGSNPHRGILEKYLQHNNRKSHCTIKLQCNVANMSEWMVWADITISAGGSTCWELAFMGTPTIAGILAENQSYSVKHLSELGFVYSCGWFQEIAQAHLSFMISTLCTDKDRRQMMSNLGREIVDGEGRNRVIDILLKE